MTQKEKEKLTGLLSQAKSQRMSDYDIIISGFRFMIHWDGRGFIGTMFFSPGWAHSHGFGAYNEKEVFQNIERLINDTCFVDGGRYPSDYRTNF